MKTISGVLGKARIGKGAVTVLAVLFILQAYFVRELLAAELLFALGFVVVLGFVAVFYAIGAASEFGLDWAEAGVRSVRRGYAMLEEISRKPFRHPRSESAQ